MHTDLLGSSHPGQVLPDGIAMDRGRQGFFPLIEQNALSIKC